MHSMKTFNEFRFCDGDQVFAESMAVNNILDGNNSLRFSQFSPSNFGPIEIGNLQ